MNRESFKSFIDWHVAPNIPPTDYNTYVDPFGNFTVKFIEIPKSNPPNYESSFANCMTIRNYEKQANLRFFDIDLHHFIKNINDVEMNINASPLEMPGVSYAMHRLMPMNSANNITMNWLNTRIPYIEKIFVPWMKANTIYQSFPLVKCDLIIKFPKLSDPEWIKNPQYADDWKYKRLSVANELEYRYYGVRPIECTMHKMTNEPVTEFYRKVTFDFDYFFVFDNQHDDNAMLIPTHKVPPPVPQKTVVKK